MISLIPAEGVSRKGNILLSYILKPFQYQNAEDIPYDHTNYWESWQMAQTYLQLGYAVDVISFLDYETIPPRTDYDYFIDIRRNLERLSPLLNKKCVKIMHIDSTNVTYRNYAECKRLLELQQRRGFTIYPQRYSPPNRAIEVADCATILGNSFTASTFAYANKSLFYVPISSPEIYPWPSAKKFSDVRNRFIWFGSFGLVHKGLDLVLEAFVNMKDCYLTICGPINKEKDFEEAYKTELYHTSNIHTYGWIDVKSKEFVAVADNHIALIFPSCAEGGGGSVLTCMHAALIPVVSVESSVNVLPFGIELVKSSIEEIQEAVHRIQSMSENELMERAQETWKYARANHTKENFAEKYKAAFQQIELKYSSFDA
ncbi:unnamed protein product [Rotaria sp. Silwood1]|nr:unnamed protein product [Rotaria sp. Silwood1]CAF3798644.1 unnamed protein product [Rotaria sp. Silwood1]CAF4749823.1 unnamed protein product [Rotaria sp. Silwood1]CAF4769596.1 unnamed protein product [Rotaria sp. Silwood1]